MPIPARFNDFDVFLCFFSSKDKCLTCSYLYSFLRPQRSTPEIAMFCNVHFNLFVWRTWKRRPRSILSSFLNLDNLSRSENNTDSTRYPSEPADSSLFICCAQKERSCQVKEYQKNLLFQIYLYKYICLKTRKDVNFSEEKSSSFRNMNSLNVGKYQDITSMANRRSNLCSNIWIPVYLPKSEARLIIKKCSWFT